MKKSDLQLIAEFLDKNVGDFGRFLEEEKGLDRGEAEAIDEEFMESIDGMPEENLDAEEELLP